MRTACAGASSDRPSARIETKRTNGSLIMAISEGQDAHEEAVEPGHDLRLLLRAATARLDAHVRDLRGAHGAPRLDGARVDGPGEAQHVDVLVDADLLL